MHSCGYACPSVCVCGGVYTTITLKIISQSTWNLNICNLWKWLGYVRHWALSDQGQGHGVTYISTFAQDRKL